MTIEPKNLVLYQSERLADTPDGGGQYNGQIVIDGQSNNLFTDVSELDRTMGRVSLRKIFAGVNTADTDMLMGATVFVSKNPSDPNVSALLFSTQSHTDERSQARNLQVMPQDLSIMLVGCVAVKKRKGGGHVCFIVGRDEKTGKLLCLGGNQSNAVNIALYNESDFDSFWWYGRTSRPAPHRFELNLIAGDFKKAGSEA